MELISKKLANFIKQYTEHTFNDRSFQRKQVWLSSDNSKYFYSLLRDRATSPLVLCDIDASKNHCEELVAQGHPEQASVEYFSDLLAKGYKYLVIDGQNRIAAIKNVFENKKELSAALIDADGNNVEVTNKFFKDMPPRLQDKIKDVSLQICLLKNLTRSQVSEVFNEINSGVALNSAEKRNAFNTPIAARVRQTSEAYKKAIARVLSPQVIMRREDDSLCANVYMHCIKKYKLSGEYKDIKFGFSDKDTNKFYELGLGLHTVDDHNSAYIPQELRRVENIMKMVSGVLTHQNIVPDSKTIPKKMFWAIVMACEYVHDNNLEITSSKDFYKDVKKINDDLEIESKTRYSNSIVELNKRNAAPEEYDNLKEKNYYYRFQMLPHQWVARNRRKECLTEAIKTNLSSLSVRKKNIATKKAA